jgi:hypothetical protein
MDEQQLLEELRVAIASVDRSTECNALGNSGIGYYQQQRWQEALDRLTEYLNLARELLYG